MTSKDWNSNGFDKKRRSNNYCIKSKRKANSVGVTDQKPTVRNCEDLETKNSFWYLWTKQERERCKYMDEYSKYDHMLFVKLSYFNYAGILKTR